MKEKLCRWRTDSTNSLTVSAAILRLAAVRVNAACASWIRLAWVSSKLDFLFLTI